MPPDSLDMPGPAECRTVLWSIRRALRAQPGDGSLAAETAAAFPGLLAGEAARSVRQVADAFGRYGQDFRSPGAPGRSHLEDIVLGAYASMRLGDRQEAAEIVGDLTGGDRERRFRLDTGLQRLAALFADENRREAGRHVREFGGRLADAGEGVSLSPALDTALLFGSRVWVAAHRSGHDECRSMRNALGGLAGPVRWDALDALLRQTTEGARRPVEVNCLCCGDIGADERRLLDGLAAARAGEASPGSALLWDWQQPASARLSLDPFTQLAASLGGASPPAFCTPPRASLH
ncbi:MAG: hypothetical protein ACMVY4_02780 [Minwuia sp.]|uniref:hypothetical protein n=1 Tax=Minwuia sp. TaxID=2493630 RepID=UPI003A88E878